LNNQTGGDTPALRVARITVEALGDSPRIVALLIGMPQLPGELILDSADYPLAPLSLDEHGLDPQAALDPLLAGASEHEKRRWLPPYLDEALAYILHPRGPAISARLEPQSNGKVRLTIQVRPAQADPTLGLPEWIHTQRVVTTWLAYGWIHARADMMQRGSGLDPSDVEAEVNQAARRDGGDRRMALNSVLASRALDGLDSLLRRRSI
jgi:hypothetical protein